jgi:ParB-like chromosome segregation protein Spo0J|tara:strand:- start:271 stop:927 length:657 start_codon:yes stop_codon:yes gene_type:complete
MDLSNINQHPLNEKIYGYNQTEHDELKKSIEMLGLLEPLTITRDNTLVSGHRRLKALKEIGWEDVDCRIGEFENLTLSLVEMNRYRKKTSTELLNEAKILKKEYQNLIKMGRPKKGEVREGKNWSIVNVSEKLGVSTTNLKKLMSIKKYEPQMLEKIDMGLISIGKAYSIIREKYILNGNTLKPKKTFKSELSDLLKKYNLNVDENVLTNIYQKLDVI